MPIEDIIHSEYFKYREIFDSFNELYNDLIADIWEFLGVPVYALDYEGNPKGDIILHWDGPFPKATYLQNVEMYLDKIIENNSIGILTNYSFIEPITLCKCQSP